MLKKIATRQNKKFDARQAGAKCDECPLRNRRPITPEVQSSKLVIVGEYPTEPDEEAGRPFTSSAGYRLDKTLRSLGTHRNQVHCTTAILCRPLEKMGIAELNKAAACCAPRLERELGENRVVVAAGNMPLKTLTGKSGIDAWFGGPLSVSTHVVVPNYSVITAFNKRAAYGPVFKEVLKRTLAIAAGHTPQWSWGRLVWEVDGPGEATIRALEELARSDRPLSIDIENRPSDGHIRCIGVGTTDLAVSVLLPPEGRRDDRAIALLNQLLSSQRLKVFQNGRHDRIELEGAGYTLSGPFFDTLIAHQILAPRLDHDLGFMAAIHFPAERWKTQFKNAKEEKGRKKKLAQVFDKAEPKELLPYNCKDVIAQARLAAVFDKELDKLHRGRELFDTAQELSEVALKMQAAGFLVDRQAQQAHRDPLVKTLEELGAEFRRIVPDEKYQLGKNGQHPSLKALLLDKLRAKALSFNKETGAPSLDGKALSRYLGMYQQTAPIISTLARIILKYRESAKLLGSYVDNLDIELDGKVHPRWAPGKTRTGRWAAYDPPLQTIPGELKDIFVADPGTVLVEADYSQLEVRLVALLSGDEKLLEWYAQDKDVYKETAKLIFKTQEVSKQQRQMAKRVVLGKNYGAGVETVWQAMLVDYPTLPISAVEYALKQFEKNHPRIEEFAQTQYKMALETGFVEETISGRRQYYHDGRVIPTEVRNFPVQGAAGTMANKAILAIDKEIDWHNGEAIIAQIHDSITLRGPDPKKLRDLLLSYMQQEITLNGNTMFFKIDIKEGTCWGHIK